MVKQLNFLRQGTLQSHRRGDVGIYHMVARAVLVVALCREMEIITDIQHITQLNLERRDTGAGATVPPASIFCPLCIPTQAYPKSPRIS